MLKGNHDYWWSTLKKMNKYTEENNLNTIKFLHNNFYIYEEKNNSEDKVKMVIIVGTRLWDMNKDDEESKRLLDREKIRLELSIKQAYDFVKSQVITDDIKVICAFHYPPINKKIVDNKQTNEIIEVIKKYGIKDVIYGHLHASSQSEAFIGEYNEINFNLVSSDYLQFNPIKIL